LVDWAQRRLVVVVQVLYSQLVGADQVVVAGVEYDMVAVFREEGPLPNRTSLAHFLCNVEA
jgi:hypothetical protein